MGRTKDNAASKLNFTLFNYFQYGGLQRDFLKTALECHKLGYKITVYTTEWKGYRPPEFDIHIIPIKGISNHQRMNNFQAEIVRIKKTNPNTPMIGFNKTDGLDIYFASDTCFKERAYSERSFLYRLTPRYKAYAQLENAVFKKASKTLILLLTEKQQQDFQKHYQTASQRFQLLPPGVNRNLFVTDRDQIRSQYREAFNLSTKDTVLLLVASSFGTKGLDRSIKALSSLPKEKLENTILLVVGGGKRKPFIKQAKQLKVDQRIIFAGACEDAPKIMLCADVLIHPAYTESAGMVLVEAITAGLPVLTTDNCGYAHHVKEAKAGITIPMPFEQEILNKKLLEVLESTQRKDWRVNAMQYADTVDLYSLHKHAAQLITNQARAV